MEPIGINIRKLRRSKGMTQMQLAEALSVSPQTVSKWENCLSVPDVSLLPVIARYFGITMDDLFGYRLDALHYRERFIRFMAEHGVLRFGRFPLRSGRISPYYIHTGSPRSGRQITELGTFYAECMQENHIKATLLAGQNERDLPVLIAAGMVLYNKYGLDMAYCTDRAAPHTENTVLIKDTLTTGTTLREYLALPGCRTTDILVSVDRMEKGLHSSLSARHEIENTCSVKIHAVVNLDDIIRALENGVIPGREYLDAVYRYRETYKGD